MKSIMNGERGFTLIELLVVIAIIGILSSVVLASLNSARQKSRDARRIGDVKQLQLALEMYYDSNNAYPSTTSALAPTYIPIQPTDPQSGSAYDYATNAGGTTYLVRATLEADHNALDSDTDGTVLSTDCSDSASGYYYCVQP